MSEAVPSQFKKARVLPLFKKGSRLDPNNYRPVSILNCLSKILERAVHGQLVQYLEKHKVLYEFQSGFRSKYSTDTTASQERPNSRCNDHQYLVLLQMYCFLHMNIRGCVCELEHSLTLCGKLIRMVQLNWRHVSHVVAQKPHNSAISAKKNKSYMRYGNYTKRSFH